MRGIPVVGTEDAYFALRGLTVAEGETPLLLGDCTLGAAVAEDLGLGVGDTLTLDTRTGLDLATAVPVTLNIVGVLEPAGTIDDDAAFMTLQTAWFAEGRIHGHGEASGQEGETRVIGRTDEHVALSAAVPNSTRVSDENRGGFHAHGDPSTYPVTCFVLFPEDDRSRTIAAARYDAMPGVRAVQPIAVVEEVLASVLRVKGVFDVIAAGLGLVTVALLACVAMLTARLRVGEMRTLREIGAARGTPALLYAIEFGMILVVGLGGAAAIVAGVVFVFGSTTGWL